MELSMKRIKSLVVDQDRKYMRDTLSGSKKDPFLDVPNSSKLRKNDKAEDNYKEALVKAKDGWMMATRKCRPGASALTKAEDIVAVSNWTKNYPYTPQSMPKPEQHLFCGNVAVNGLPIFCMFLRDAKAFVWVPIEQFSFLGGHHQD